MSWPPHDVISYTSQAHKEPLLGLLSVFLQECHAGESCLMGCAVKLGLLGLTGE